jgi:hypothetical protein
MLHYVFVLLHNALTVLRSVIASIIYHSRHIGAVIASYNYFSKLIYQLYCFYSLSLFCCYLSAFQHLQILRFIFFLAECAHNTGNTNITPIFCYTTSQLTPRGKNVAAGRWTLFLPEIYCTFMHLFKTRFYIYFISKYKCIKCLWRLVLQQYSDNTMLQFAFSHNAFAHWRKFILLVYWSCYRILSCRCVKVRAVITLKVMALRT